MHQTMEKAIPHKPTLEVLDSLRCIGALAVILFHSFEVYSTSMIDQKVNHGYFAVDFFFLLSGYVLSFSYDDRLDGTKVTSFLKMRLFRLHPTAVCGGVLGLVLFYFGKGDFFPLIAETGILKVFFIFLLTLFIVPVPPCLDIRGYNESYPLNCPLWSLMYEYIGNIFYAFFYRKLSAQMTFLISVFASFFVFDVALDMNCFGFYTGRETTRYYLSFMGGWTLEKSQFYIGVVRFFYSFSVGVFLSKAKIAIKLQNGFYISTLLLSGVLVMPRIGGATTGLLNSIFDGFVILIVLPLIISIGAGSTINNESIRKVSKFISSFSYQTYIVNYPIIYLEMAWVYRNQEEPYYMHVSIWILTVLSVYLTGYVLMRFIDTPVRAYLNQYNTWNAVKRVE
ncbi:hypothetical protein EIN_359810 [Entamoeba invadens IP1]|uniref:Acyltransferase 3 domain-containing protein n=1 Tax=Entamoeba invadens IP1 TaxID=370355 RepID=A0A0A1U7N1_ENTIV|nr:hypothetical protein EIN_359810 [Entamoeba invadens IP1]ELP90888.1 hypothetical protein EIN_359810 [Entamoeba invadens IP1]|eukprot:XP_004257659.1 hypothetical protein EIN_359810 [Entamoeba invadens IP1]